MTHRACATGRWRGERGQVLVLTAILVPLLLIPIGAFAVDVGHWYVIAKRAQNTADAGALAAAQELPAQAQAESLGRSYVSLNYPGVEGTDVSVVTPYNGDASKVEVTVHVTSGTFFGGVIGIPSVDITRRAVAEKYEGNTKLAIFAGSTSCADQKGLHFDGDAINIEGHVHSNGKYNVNSATPPNHWTATSGTIARENCLADVSPDGPPAEDAGAQYTSTPGEWLPQDGEELQWPDWWYPSEFGWYLSEGPGIGRCTYKGEDIQVDATTLKITGRPDQQLQPHPTKPGWTVIPPGTYCGTKSFKIGGNNHAGQITALSPLIQIDGNGQEYTPHAFEMLFFTVPNSDNDPTNDDPYALGNFSPPEIPPYEPCLPSPAFNTELNGENYSWGGIIFNPCGKVLINNKTSSVGSPQLVGTIYAFQVHVNGDGFNMVGTEEVEDFVSLALVE